MRIKGSLLFCGLLLLPAVAAVVGAQTLTLQATADTSLRHATPNQVRGGEPLLQVSSSSRGLVRFDSAALAQAVGSGRLVSASLELFVRSAGGWGSGGRPLEARALTSDWTEAGATWSCAVDSQPANNRADCASQWSGGAFAEDASDTILQTAAEGV